jgi:hypothetical protein
MPLNTAGRVAEIAKLDKLTQAKGPWWNGDRRWQIIRRQGSFYFPKKAVVSYFVLPRVID